MSTHIDVVWLCKRNRSLPVSCLKKPIGRKANKFFKFKLPVIKGSWNKFEDMNTFQWKILFYLPSLSFNRPDFIVFLHKVTRLIVRKRNYLNVGFAFFNQRPTRRLIFHLFASCVAFNRLIRYQSSFNPLSEIVTSLSNQNLLPLLAYTFPSESRYRSWPMCCPLLSFLALIRLVSVELVWQKTAYLHFCWAQFQKSILIELHQI